MQYYKLAALFGFAASFVQAAPYLTRATTGFSSECSNINLNSNWLVADCPNDAGDLISSGVFLPLHISNNNGQLQWQTNGEYYESCDQCELLNSSSTLQCYCTGTYASQTGNSTLDLEEHIANYDGHLLSDLEGTPTVPADASIAVPSNVNLILFGGDTASTCPPTDYSTLEFQQPEACWDLNLAVNPIVWGSLYTSQNSGWSVKVYNVSGCSGTPVATLDSQGECLAAGESGAYLSFTPLWNWD